MDPTAEDLQQAFEALRARFIRELESAITAYDVRYQDYYDINRSKSAKLLRGKYLRSSAKSLERYKKLVMAWSVPSFDEWIDLNVED